MMTTDPIADMLTRIRNGIMSNKQEVISQGGFKQLSIELNGPTQPESLVRVSKPGRRIYAKASEIPVVRTGRGIVIVSTPVGIMTGRDARKKGIGGELICKVY